MFFFLLITSLSVVGEWLPVGGASAIESGKNATITIATTQPIAAGAVRMIERIPGDALLVTTTASSCAAGEVILSLAEVESGAAISQFRNPLPLSQPTQLAAVLTVPTKLRGRGLLLFAGTQHATNLELTDVKSQPVRSQMISRWTSWGALIGDGKVAGQSFTAAGSSCRAVSIVIRQLNENTGGPDLRARLFAIGQRGEIDRGRPLAETIIPRSQIPRADLDATISLVVPISAPTQRGRKFLVEFDTTAPCDGSGAFLLLGGPDAYAAGQRFENSAALAEGDLCMTVYEGIDQ